MKPFKELTESENQALLKFPAYISLLAANAGSKLDEAEKKSAIKFSHIKTYSCNPLLFEFYVEADKVFENNIQYLDDKLPVEKEQREEAIRTGLLSLEKMVLTLGKGYASAMHQSMKSFKDHVAKAHNSVIADFIIPIPIKGITYQ